MSLNLPMKVIFLHELFTRMFYEMFVVILKVFLKVDHIILLCSLFLKKTD